VSLSILLHVARKPRITGELCFRITAGNDAFENGSDLLRTDGRLYMIASSLSSFKILSFSLYEILREGRLIPKDLPSEIQLLPESRFIYIKW
jgi:hypothetical protein